MSTTAKETKEKEYEVAKGVEGTLMSFGITFVHDSKFKIIY
jgi:hypothetical protein